MTSESAGWRGDVGQGVRAWTGDAARSARPGRSARAAPSGRPARPGRSGPPPDPERQGPEADPEQVARTILLDQLTGRARSRRELSDKLASRQVPVEVAERVLDRFEEVGLVDDESFARTWVTQRQSAAGGGRGLARRALAGELRRKGVDDETARGVLDEIDPDAEEQAARLLVQRKLRTVARVDETTTTRRLVGMLARKGYSGALAYAVVRSELADSGREASAPED